MDVAFVSNVVYPYVTGGAEKRIHEIGTRLSARGHEVSIYSRQFWKGPEEINHDGITLRAVAPGADLYVDERRSIPEAIGFAARLLRPLARELRTRDHDVIVVSVFPYFPVLSAALSRLGTDTSMLTTWHEVWQDYWDDYLGLLSFGGKIVEKVVARVPQYPIAVSGITARRLAQIGPDLNEVNVVPNGIDIEKINTAPRPDENGSEPYDVLFAGRLIPEKNVSTLLDAFDTVAQRHDATLGIIGDGPEADSLRRQANSLTNSDRVDFLGFLEDHVDVLGHMRAARVFASPSTREGFGIVFAEAMAADCTVIAADHPESAASEVVGDAGFVVEPSINAVADTLNEALDGKRPPEEPTTQAQQYDWDSITTQAESTYQRAIAGDW